MTLGFLICTTTRWTTQYARPPIMAYSFSTSPSAISRSHRHTSESSTTLPSQVDDPSKTEKETGREKRKKFIGLAKAVDRGQYHSYNPLKEGRFVAKSGLPKNIREGKLFTVLGIESSCDDTGGELCRCIDI